MSTVVATVGTIPGAGTTSVVAALGAALGEQRLPVAVVDATPEGSRIGDVLDLEDGGEVADALRRSASLGEVQAAGPHGLVAFPASADTNWGAVRPDAVGTVYEQLRERFEFVLVDCGSELTPATAAWLGHADEVLVVTDPDVAGSIEETAALAAAFGVSVRGVAGNRVPTRETEAALTALGATGHPVLAVLPEDRTVATAAHAGASVLAHEPDSPIANCVWRLALRFREGDHAEAVVPRGTVGSGQAASAPADGPRAGADAAAESETDDTRRTVASEASAASGGGASAAGGDGSSGTAASSATSPSGDPTETTEAGETTKAPGSDADSRRTTRSTGRSDDEAASGSATDRSSAAGSGKRELSDEEIEEVFKETMKRVKRERENEE